MKKNIFLSLFLGISIGLLGLWIYTTLLTTAQKQDHVPTEPYHENTLDEKQLAHLTMSDTVSIIMFHAPWCSVCTAMLEGDNPVYTTFMHKKDPRLHNLTYRSFHVDIDTSPLAKRYPVIMNVDEKTSKITGVPTFVFIKKGKEVHREVGSLSIDRLVELTKEYHTR